MSLDRGILNSVFVIDGVQKDRTPAQLLDAVSAVHGASERGATVVDESVDPVFKSMDTDPRRIDSYLEAVMGCEPAVPIWDAGQYTVKMLAMSLIDALWFKGHFVLGDIRPRADWRWNNQPIGSWAALYDSVESVADYMDALGLVFSSWSCTAVDGESRIEFTPELCDGSARVGDDPFSTSEPWMLAERICPDKLVDDPQSWLVYVPFDPCSFRLGGTLLAQSSGVGGGVSSQVSDADYFIDCYEVVRELAEDGILLSAATVGHGGLLGAVKSMASDKAGADIDISDMMHSYGETDPIRMLFGEVPGVLLQIRDYDFDYLDAELLLQDVAFFPLGHPVSGSPDVRVRSSAKTGIQKILESLMQNAEGED